MTVKKAINHLEEYEWVGEFYFPNHKDQRFSGTLIYKPQKGVQVKYISSVSLDFNESDTVLFGNIEEIGEVTLVTYQHRESEYDDLFKLDGISEGEIHIKYALIGKHLRAEEQEFEGCSFKLNNINEFCAPFSRSHVPYSKDPVLESKTTWFDFELRTEATGLLASDLVNQHLVIRNDDFKNELRKAVDDVVKKYPKEMVIVKKELEFIFYLESKGKSFVMDSMFDAINNISSLFSILLAKNINIVELKIKKKQEKHEISLLVLKSLYLRDKAFKDMSKNKSGGQILMGLSCIPSFDDVFAKWISLREEKMNLFNESFFSRNALDTSNLHAFIVLCAAVEQWMDRRNIAKKKKYDRFLDDYATDKLRNRIKDNMPLQKKSESLGMLLGMMRNMIVHPISNKECSRFNDYINEINIGNICESIFICFLIAHYRYLGLKKESVKKFEDEHHHHFPRYVRF